MANWIDVAAESDLPSGKRLPTMIEGRPLVLFNVDGEVKAIEDVCPHAGMPLADGDLNGKTLTCIYHGYAYNLDSGKNVDFADDVPACVFPANVENGRIFINLDRD